MMRLVSQSLSKKKRLREYLEEIDGLTHSQYGFRKEKSTIDALSRLNVIVINKRRKNYTGMLTVDFKKCIQFCTLRQNIIVRIKKDYTSMPFPHYRKLLYKQTTKLQNRRN